MCLSLYMTSTVLPSNSSTNAYLSNSVLCRYMYSTYLCPLEASWSLFAFVACALVPCTWRSFSSVHLFHYMYIT